MSLSQALSAAAGGLRATQAGIGLVSSNVANAETPGYVRKTLTRTTTVGAGLGVRVGAINREIDSYLQRQVRTESSGGTYAGTRAQFYDRLQLMFGQPGADSSLETSYNKFTSALQALAATPDSYATRSAVVTSAQTLAQQLNGLSKSIQQLRSDAQNGMADAVRTANEAMRQIAAINRQLASSSADDMSAAGLKDQRDRYIDQLSELMDIRVAETGPNQVSVFTSSGQELAGTYAAQLRLDSAGPMTPQSLWNADPASSTLPTITLVSPNGGDIDLLAGGGMRSGKLAAFVEMRDQVLPAAQGQLDALAAAMALALSERTRTGSPAALGAQTGFEIDLTGLVSGNSAQLVYTDVATSTQRVVTFVRVDDAAALPLKNSASINPNDRVVGIDGSLGPASVAAQIAAALGPGFTVTNPSGNTLRILDDGAAGTTDVNGLSATWIETGFTSGSVEMPFFMDAGGTYSGAFTKNGSQLVGLAGRITVNSALIADPARLVRMSASTPAGDTVRANFLLDRMSIASLDFAPGYGIGTETSPFRSSVPDYLRQLLALQGDAAAGAKSLSDGQDVVVNALQQRLNEASGVNIDQEMTYLLQLQSAYGANARVLSAIKEMLDILQRM
ncbi:MAG: flagellar hook-associated protein 1 [Variibacter sp.]|nr:flagellar hook-associated protein 1 [Variibacter sp.]